MSVDPLFGSPDNPQSLNRYTYVLNNPLRFVDPTGMRARSLEDERKNKEQLSQQCPYGQHCQEKPREKPVASSPTGSEPAPAKPSAVAPQEATRNNPQGVAPVPPRMDPQKQARAARAARKIVEKTERYREVKGPMRDLARAGRLPWSRMSLLQKITLVGGRTLQVISQVFEHMMRTPVFIPNQEMFAPYLPEKPPKAKEI